MNELNIPPGRGNAETEREAREYDLVSLGALVTRLDPGIVPVEFADEYRLFVSGGEYNVAANLAQAFNRKTAIVSAMVDYPIGRKVESEVRRMGVDSFYRRFQHNGVFGPNIAQVWSDRGNGVRAPVVFYNRSHEAAALLGPGSFDWKKIFSKGVRWFHSGGIFAALSPSTAPLIIEGMKEARKAGAVISFDLNYREKLWKVHPEGEKNPSEYAQKILGEIVRHVDVLVGNEEDLQKGLGLEGPEVGKKTALDPAAFFGMIEKLQKAYPNIKAVATTLREVHSANRHDWSAVLWMNGKNYSAPVCELDVHDRVGGGDGFAAGLIHGLLAGHTPEAALKTGWAHGALLTTYPGDTSMATPSQVEAFAAGGSARIQR